MKAYDIVLMNTKTKEIHLASQITGSCNLNCIRYCEDDELSPVECLVCVASNRGTRDDIIGHFEVELNGDRCGHCFPD